MSNLAIRQVLDQIHLMQDQVRGTRIQGSAPTDFGNLLKQSIDQVNQTQFQAARAAESFEKGEPGLNLSDVMIAQEKAGVSFQAMVQVRNKLVEAYKDVMNMPM